MTNPTSNFGWQMPTSADLVTDLPADFEVFGQAVDTSLADLKGGTTGQVLSKATGTDMDFSWVTPTTGMTNPMTTTGDTIYSSSGSTPARLGIGSTGQVLTVSGGVPSWATPSGSKVVQIVFASTSTTKTVSTYTWTDTALTATITPTSASNKVLIFYSQNGCYASGAGKGVSHRLMCNGSDQLSADYYIEGGAALAGNISNTFLHSPASTSALTYKTQIASSDNSSFVNAQRNTTFSTMILMEVTP